MNFILHVAAPTTLRDEETKQVEFVSSTGIHAQRIFIYDGAQLSQYGYYNPDQIRSDANYGTASNPKVFVMEEFKNSEANHLGMGFAQGQVAILSPRYRWPPGVCRRKHHRPHAEG